ncbi:restriction endonuclease subunit S [Vibrio artabrorum]|uniref:Restriction endonuclease subunit S n=1 Tax=Vibrio artabrorum TaxID=446374 RepID=A0ABT8CL42_9VIBR|nr:restriction endonuclease subunit S [Vibrio artabrorum]MDN3702471.1 restriction endonuclease subunit S [Vibrio artabrorum]
MSDFEKELEQITQEMGDEPEVQLPSIEEQKAIVAELKRLEAEGKLTPDVLEKHFGQFNKTSDTPPIH